MTSDSPLLPRTRLRAPKAAAIAGILFSVLLIISLVLILLATPPTPLNETGLLSQTPAVLLSLNLVPFAGIAFLWFMGVVRDLLGEREDQFFSTVFFGSGLLFVAMLFVSSAVAGSLLLLTSRFPESELLAVYDLGHSVARETLSTYGIRMAGVFMISSCTLFLRTGVIPRWTAWLGYGFAAVMLFRMGYINSLGWVTLLFPLWVLLVSLHILTASYTHRSDHLPLG
ncbi:hypothetical protein GFS31_42750 (plasmid) [Leptolyngbya sp. BL0902]|uniref:hypothetical protein n=1 Tax=Leptolyngbya sp. BL0902 TaxID=1115757 RepID=UPI0018E80BFD|nr:hypothetical protein [Leptolyngbya sp. BL0902]QQE67562.1 hypothetical protein GFS31_42750 [Leptolyngbya sp. BL0902]